jgi:predicted membrane metal-binding protein
MPEPADERHALLISGDENAAVAGVLATAITLLGALAFGPRGWPLFLSLASCVLIVLLVAPDAYVAFGLWCLFAVLTAAIATATKAIYKSIKEPPTCRR